MQVSIKQLARESIDEHDEEQHVILEQQMAELEITNKQVTSVSAMECVSLGMEDRGFLRKVGGDLADGLKIMFAWTDSNGSKIRRIRQEIREARQSIEQIKGITITGSDVRGGGLLVYLGNKAHHAQSADQLVHLVNQDVDLSKKMIGGAIDGTGKFSKELVEWIYSKDNDWKWGYDEAVDGSVEIINAHISKLTAFGKDRRIEGYDHNDLRVEDGSEFSPLLLGNYALSTSWNFAHEQSKHLPTSAEALETYALGGGHDFVKIPKAGTKYSMHGQITKKQLLDLLDAADAYLDLADDAAKSIKANAFPVWKMLMSSNMLGGNISMTAKVLSSKNYRALYTAMLSARNWSMKLQRKSATRNQDLAKHLASFVKLNSK